MNISDIAKMAGVSRATVSRYFNNGYVGADKKEKIKEVIEKTGFRPSMSAQALRTKKSKLIGVIAPKISSETISRIVDGLGSELNSQGYHMLLGSTDNDAAKEVEYMQVFINNNVDGIILIGTYMTEAHRRVMKNLNMPLVVIGQSVEGYCSVYHDDYHAARDMTRLLLQGNVHKPVFLGVTEKDEAVGRKRKEGYADELQARGISVEKDSFTICSFTSESGYENMDKMIATHPDLDAVFCVTDTIALGAIKALRSHGKRIPEDVAVSGMGGKQICEMIEPRLSTVAFAYMESGVIGARMLLELLQNEEAEKKKQLLTYELIKGESTRA